MINYKKWRDWGNKEERRDSTRHIPNIVFHWVGDIISICIVGFAYCTFKQMKIRTNLQL